ncbi:MAG TPA: hypothetical protein DD735_07275 [Clostridiales bacterium]|nr:hypothetical protein [Clostridiales bacterium]
MTKGKFGLSTAAVAVIAFGFAALRQSEAVLLIAGFALLAEKDEWLNRQAMQALLLTIAYFLTALVTGWVFGGLGRLFGFFEVYRVENAMLRINSAVGDLIYVALIALSVIAVLRVLRGRDAGLPWLSKMAGGDFEAAFARQPKSVPAPVQTSPAMQAAPAQAPYVQPAMSAVQDAQASPAVRICSSCSAPLQEDSRFCTACGAKAE